MGVFEQFRHYSSNELQQKYKYLVKDVQSLNNKKSEHLLLTDDIVSLRYFVYGKFSFGYVK